MSKQIGEHTYCTDVPKSGKCVCYQHSSTCMKGDLQRQMVSIQRCFTVVELMFGLVQ